MNEENINRNSIVELIDIIKNSTDKNQAINAETELESRNLTQQQLNTAQAEYERFKKFQLERKDKTLTNNEWLSFFFLPFFTPRPRWRTNDHFTESEFERFEKYGYDRKSKEASKVQTLGVIFWILLIIVISLATRLYGN
jgi:hypothetical protein